MVGIESVGLYYRVEGFQRKGTDHSGSQANATEGVETLAYRCSLHGWVEEELVGEQLYQSCPKQDTC